MQKKITTETLPWMILLLVILTTSRAPARPDQQVLDREITIELKDVPLSVALIEIEIVAAVKFVYSPSQLDLGRTITVIAERKKLRTILNDMFGPMAIKYTVDQDKEYILLKPVKAASEESSLPQKQTDPLQTSQVVTGKVIDAVTGQPMAGVNVIVKGTASGTSTDSEGEYTIDAKDNDVLVFTFIGYKKFEIQVGGRMIIEVALEEDVASLDEVIVNAGYYLTTDKLKTGNISRVTAKEIENQPVTNPLMALQGRMTGVDVTPNTGIPGGGINIKIRGQNSLRFDGGYPLYVIDGVPVNSSPIESASSILLGEYDPLSTLNPANILSIEVLKDADATAIYGSRGANGVILITTKQGIPGKTTFDVNLYRGIGKVVSKMNLLKTEQYLEIRKEAFNNNNQVITEANAPDLLVWDTTRYTDWQDELLGGTANISDIQGNISGGNENTSFRFGGGFHKETTIFPGDFHYQRANGHFSFDHSSADKKFNVALSANYGSSINNLFDNTAAVLDGLKLPPNAPKLHNADGSLNWEPYGPGPFNSTWTNPLADFRKTTDSRMRTLLVNSTLSYNLFPGLTIKGNLGFTDGNTAEGIKRPINSYDPAFAAFISPESIFGTTSQKSWLVEPQILYLKKFNDHQFDLVVGTTWQENTQEYKLIFTSGYASDALLGSMRGAANIFIGSDDDTRYRYTALFARLGYHWKETYFLNFTGRRDGSSRFGPENRFGNFGAVGAAWIFSNERFIRENVQALSFSKLRASFGTTGNDQIGDYQYLNTYSTSPNNYNGAVGLSPTALLNADYSWEVNKKLEVTLELGFINDRIMAGVTLYRNESSNQLLQYQLPGTAGFTSILKNLDATIENTGFELTLTGRNINSENFKWNISANFTAPRNKLVKFPGLETSPYANSYITGKPLTIQKFYTLVGVNQETGIYEFIDENSDDIINSVDRKFIGDLGRKYYGGVLNSFTYKSFELSFLIQFVKQVSMSYVPPTIPGQMINIPVQIYADRWQKPGDVSKFEKVSSGSSIFTPYLNHSNSNARLEDASFLRLKSLSLSYSLENKVGVPLCKFYLQGQNLFTLTDFTALDPETGSDAIPPLKMLTIGTQFRF